VRESNPCHPAGTNWLRSHVNSVSGAELRIAPEESSEVTAICYSPRAGPAVAPAHLSLSGGGRVIRIKCDHMDVCFPLFPYTWVLLFSRCKNVCHIAKSN
jgi:hypothetical protein